MSAMVNAGSVVVVAGDWHGNTQWALTMVRRVPDGVSTLIQVGDFGLMGAGFAKYVHRVNAAAADRGIEVWVIPGNHENYNWIDKQPFIDHGRARIASHTLILPRGYRFLIGDSTLACAVGGAVSVDRRYRKHDVTWWPQEAVTDAQVEQIIDCGPADVLFTHDMPTGTACPTIDRASLVRHAGPDVADETYAHHARIRAITDGLAPAVLVHGHMHIRYTDTVQWAAPHGDTYTCSVEGLACDQMDGNLIALSPSPTPAINTLA